MKPKSKILYKSFYVADSGRLEGPFSIAPYYDPKTCRYLTPKTAVGASLTLRVNRTIMCKCGYHAVELAHLKGWWHSHEIIFKVRLSGDLKKGPGGKWVGLTMTILERCNIQKLQAQGHIWRYA